MVLTFGMSTPHIHILNTDAKPILDSVAECGENISAFVEKYQTISGVTPSKAALRIFSLVLRKEVWSTSKRFVSHSFARRRESLKIQTDT
jgi:hypothetical protein